MSESEETPQPVDLSGLQMMPDWVNHLGTEKPKTYEKYEDGGDRHPGSQGGKGGRGGPRGNPREGGRGSGGWNRDGDRRGGASQGRDRRGGRGGDRGGYRGQKGGRQVERRTPELPKGIRAYAQASEESVVALVARIKTSGRAFGMFDLAKVVLADRKRFEVVFEKESAEGGNLFRCKGDSSVWQTRDQAVRHFLRGEGVSKYYRLEEKELEAPKGDFKTVAVCGMSGVLIGPPNHHSYQTAVIRLHQQRFSNMPIERFKSRIRTEADEELVAKWKEEQSKTTEYFFPKEPSEDTEEFRLPNLEELERHFRVTLAEEAVESLERVAVEGGIPGKNLSPELLNLLRQTVEGLQRNPFELVKSLCSQLEKRGLKIFKRQGKKLFVSKARPRAIPSSTPLSEGICDLIEAVSKTPGVKVSEVVTRLAPRHEGEELKKGELSAAETTILSNLRWLIDEGFLIEYSSTALFLGVQGGDEKGKKAKRPKLTVAREGEGGGTTAEEARGTADEAPTITEEVPATAEEASATAEETSATAEEAPATAEEAPATAEEVPGAAEEVPGAAEEVP
ncbi:MAG: hypothetical protein AAF191_14885, partial [Verrucomicrobiota bacterium]